MKGTKMQVKMADIATALIGGNGQTSHRLHDLTLTVTPGIGYGAVVDVFDGANPMRATHASLYLTQQQVYELIRALAAADGLTASGVAKIVGEVQ